VRCHSGPWAHLRRGSEPIGGANISFPHPAFLKFHLDNYHSRSLIAQGPRNFPLKKCSAHRVSPRRHFWKYGNDYHFVAGCRWWAPGRQCRRFWSAHHQRKKHRWWALLGGGAGGPGAPTNNIKTLTVGPLGGGARGPEASTINTKNVDGGHPRRPCRWSGSTHHQCKKTSAAGPWKAVPKVQERSPST
jgi:hypothetical protein